MILLYLNGVAVPTPVTYDVSLADVQSANSGRNDNGVMTMDIVRHDVANIKLEWQYLTDAEVDLIMENIDMAEIAVKYYFGGYKEATMYKGDRTLSLKLVEGENSARWTLGFSLIEY